MQITPGQPPPFGDFLRSPGPLEPASNPIGTPLQSTARLRASPTDVAGEEAYQEEGGVC